jgi:uncharacterized membrane protein
MTETNPANSPDEPADLSSSAKENLELLTRIDDLEHAKVSGVQLLIERISALLGSPAYFIFAVTFITLWILINRWGAQAGWPHVDAPPYPWLQGIVSSNALLLTVAVLIRQNRMAQMAEHRSHLDLQINLLTEQKVTKIVQLVDELQREFTQLRGKPDTQNQQQLEEMTKPADAHALLHAIKHKKADP